MKRWITDNMDTLLDEDKPDEVGIGIDLVLTALRKCPFD